jgi:hypothetical protein
MDAVVRDGRDRIKADAGRAISLAFAGRFVK